MIRVCVLGVNWDVCFEGGNWETGLGAREGCQKELLVAGSTKVRAISKSDLLRLLESAKNLDFFNVD